MKYLLLAFCLLLAPTAQAQALARPVQPITYCMLIATGDHFNSTGLLLDYGQGKSPKDHDAQLEALNVQVGHLTSIAAALNLLVGQGWEYVQVATMPREPYTSNLTTRYEVGYLLRRKP